MNPKDRMQLRSLAREFRQRFPNSSHSTREVAVAVRDLRLFVEATEFFFDKTDKGEVAKRRERLFGLCQELDVEMDGVSPIPATAAAILNGIRSIVNEER